jgi:hypothetical protein
MIPYTLSCLLPSSSYTENENVTTCFLMCEHRDELLNEIITDINEYMYEFCSKEYGYDIEISSYDDFCEKWWNLQECKMVNFYIFEIHYFDNNCWNILDLKEHSDEIYKEYVKYLQAK